VGDADYAWKPVVVHRIATRGQDGVAHLDFRNHFAVCDVKILQLLIETSSTQQVELGHESEWLSILHFDDVVDFDASFVLYLHVPALGHSEQAVVVQGLECVYFIADLCVEDTLEFVYLSHGQFACGWG